MNIIVTNHAAERFRERFGRGNYSLHECRELIAAAVRESKSAPKKVRRKLLGTLDYEPDKHLYLYHFESSLVFVAEYVANEAKYKIVTCYPVI